MTIWTDKLASSVWFVSYHPRREKRATILSLPLPLLWKFVFSLVAINNKMPVARRRRRPPLRRIEWERERWGKLHFIFNVQSKVLPQVAFIFGASNVM